MLLSRRTRVQPGGAPIVPPLERRGVMTAIMTSPGISGGWAIVSEVAFDVRAIELPRTPIDPWLITHGSSPSEPERSTIADAGRGATAASSVAARTVTPAKIAVCRGRLPSMFCSSALRTPG